MATSPLTSTMAVQTGPKGILSLPAELHIEIAKEADDDGLRALHHTCRQLTSNTMDVFASRFFQRRRHIYTSHALTALRDITAVPHLARQIQHITLVVVDVRPMKDQLFATYSEIHASPRTIQACKLWYDNERARLRENGIERLAQIFTNLKNLGAGRHLKLTDRRTPRSCGRKELARRDSEACQSLFSDRRWNLWGLAKFVSRIRPWASAYHYRADDMTPERSQIDSALAQSKHLLETLDQGWDYRPKECKARNLWNVSDSRLAKVSVSRSSLKALNLKLDNHITMDALAHLLRSATGLAELSLFTAHAPNLEMFRNIVNKHQLTSVTLCGIRCEHLDIVRFLASHAKTLEHLDFSHMELVEYMSTSQGWEIIFTLGSKRLRLKSLQLYALLEGPDYTGFESYYLPEIYRFGFFEEGDERCMRVRLAALVRDALFKVSAWEDREDKNSGLDDIQTPHDVTGFNEWKPEAIEELRAWEEWRACEDGGK